MPIGATWQMLLQDATIGDFVSRMKSADVIVEVRGLTSWNTRWMVGPNSENTADKKAVIQTMVVAGTA
eukprot:8697446-Lingulodinium_polyedra.AAC.1